MNTLRLVLRGIGWTVAGLSSFLAICVWAASVVSKPLGVESALAIGLMFLISIVALLFVIALGTTARSERRA